MVDDKEHLEEATASQEDEQLEEPKVEESVDTEAQLKEQLLRALAETENIRKRAVRDREEATKYALTHFARDMLAILDNLSRALNTLPFEKESELSPELKAMIEGVRLTEKELLQTFEKHGIRKVDPKGKTFDHAFHQAMFEEETDDHPEGTIFEVLQPGYILHDRLLRPAMVGVAKPRALENAPPTLENKQEKA